MKKNIILIIVLLSFQSVYAQQFKKVQISDRQLTGPTQDVVPFLKERQASENEAFNYLQNTHIQHMDYRSANEISYVNKDGSIWVNGSIADEFRSLSLETQIQSCYQKLRKNDKYSIQLNQNDANHPKYDQYYNGVRIFEDQLIFHSKENQIKGINGVIHSNIHDDFNTIPQLDIAQAKSTVELDIEHHFVDLHDHKLPKHNLENWKEELVIFHKNNLPTLSYFFEARPNHGEWYTYIIDANTGEIINHYSNICKFHDHGHLPPDGPATSTATDLLGNNVSINTYEFDNTFFMIDGSRPMFSAQNSNLPNDPVGAIWTIDADNTAPQNNNFTTNHFVSNNNNWNRPEAVSAQLNGGKAYEYFKNTHNRESIDGGGSTIVSIVNVSNEDGSSMGNAFYNGAWIFYGNGDNAFFPLGRALDVAGHELSHGVVLQTANLIYEGESGAMNESFADIFGAMIDREDWLIGEDVVKTSFFPSGALRDMQDPHNGANTGDFGSGWQPKHVNEQYTGNQDNGGVHINSGIPNHAYYRIATDIGKTKAENIFYRALNNYLTRSSKFVDLRLAAESATRDLYGSGSELTAVQNGFDAVGIITNGTGTGSGPIEDTQSNDGTDYLLFADQNLSNLYIIDFEGFVIFNNPLTTSNPISKPSITDDGSAIVFVADDNKLHGIILDWDTGESEEIIIQNEAIWRNVVISKDGSRIAALMDELDNELLVFDFNLSEWNTFELFNPTFSEGVSTGDVQYADAMEFDISSNFVMYDAFNEADGPNGSVLDFWDISFIQVSSAGNWANGDISKLFPALPEDISIGNPSFSKNSPYIVAFDYIDDEGVLVLGANVENGDVGLIAEPENNLGYPNYSRLDDRIIYDINGNQDLGIVQMSDNKIQGIENTSSQLLDDARWATWFSNGIRPLNTSTKEINHKLYFELSPNPASDLIHITSDHWDSNSSWEIKTMEGKSCLDGSNASNISIKTLPSGVYVFTLKNGAEINSRLFYKK